MWQIFEFKFVRFFIHQKGYEEMFFEEHDRLIGIFFIGVER
jgi:hypothetical protein